MDNGITDVLVFRSIVLEELIHKGTYTLIHHAVVNKNDVTVKHLRGYST